jgi:hypothetical protein
VPFATSNVENNKRRYFIVIPSVGYATKYIDISLNYTHYNHFDRLNSNGSLGRELELLRLAYGFQL